MVAMVVVVLCIAVFSEGWPAPTPSKETPTAENASEESPGSELVKIIWQTDLPKGGEEQPNPESRKTVPQPKDEGETD